MTPKLLKQLNFCSFLHIFTSRAIINAQNPLEQKTILQFMIREFQLFNFLLEPPSSSNLSKKFGLFWSGAELILRE